MTNINTKERTSQFIDLASVELGGAVIYTNDDFFAPKDNLILSSEAVWKAHAYTDRGKWMDGWESRRKRTEGHDYCFIKLGLYGIVREILVDTAFFTGNYPDSCAIDGCIADPNATPEDLHNIEWFPLVENSKLKGGSKNWFDVEHSGKVTHIRFRIFPDGGVARLRIYGEVLPRLDRWRALGEIDLAAMIHGGKTVGQSDMYFGLAENLLKPHRGINMGDGWETKRSRGKGHLDWCIIELAAKGKIEFVEIDTHHFKGNFPDRCALEAATELAENIEDTDWQALLDEMKLQAHTSHEFSGELYAVENVKYLRVKIFPDGGISRLRLHGRVSEAGWEEVTLREMNALNFSDAKSMFRSFCGSEVWIEKMVNSRPFNSLDHIQSESKKVNASLSTEDWLEAFRSHPKIGESKTENRVTKKSSRWSTKEQSGVDPSMLKIREKLAEKNEAYFEKHKFIFIVFASGKSGKEMLDILEERLENTTEIEIKNAAIAQEKITKFRLEKMMRGK